MRKILSLTVIAAMTLMMSCSTQNVSIDYDRNMNFSVLKDFDFAEIEHPEHELNLQVVQTAITAELAKKGISQNNHSGYKIKIIPEEFITEKPESHIGIGMGSGGYHYGSSVSVGIPINSKKLNQVYQVSIFSPEGKMIWDSRMNLEMPASASEETIDTNIEKGVQKLFKNFPPQGK